jgi:hypothetical protein
MNPLAWLTAGTAILNKILDFIPDPAQKALAAAQLQTQMLDFAKAQMDEQAKVTDDEAQSKDPFTSRARPFILWVCGFAIAYTFLLAPFLNPLLKVLMPSYVPVVLNSGDLMGLVTAMLGLGGMHMYETVQAMPTKAKA